ncbi:MAG: hypothetical protein LBD97_06725 [Bifidobacteriaceae bacterium]|nr:hypothetical protein [Bifidobacteriaceae bacterium]
MGTSRKRRVRRSTAGPTTILSDAPLITVIPVAEHAVSPAAAPPGATAAPASSTAAPSARPRPSRKASASDSVLPRAADWDQPAAWGDHPEEDDSILAEVPPHWS